jgi:hypothetical protein
MSAPEPVVFDEFPRTLDDFDSLRRRIGQTPQGGAVTMVVALYLYARNDELGRECLAAAVHRDQLVQGSGGYLGWRLRPRDQQLIATQISGSPYLPQSYFHGTGPEGGYELPPAPYECRFEFNPYSGDPASGRFKVFIQCSGAASARPVEVLQDGDGLWLAHRWSSLLLGIQKPGP